MKPIPQAAPRKNYISSILCENKIKPTRDRRRRNDCINNIVFLVSLRKLGIRSVSIIRELIIVSNILDKLISTLIIDISTH